MSRENEIDAGKRPASIDLSIVEAAAGLGLFVTDGRVCCFDCDGWPHYRDTLVLFPSQNRFECYACGLKGNVLDLIAAQLECSNKDAARWARQLRRAVARGDGPVIESHVTRTRIPSEQAIEVYCELYQNTFEILDDTDAGEFLTTHFHYPPPQPAKADD